MSARNKPKVRVAPRITVEPRRRHDVEWNDPLLGWQFSEEIIVTIRGSRFESEANAKRRRIDLADNLITAIRKVVP